VTDNAPSTPPTDPALTGLCRGDDGRIWLDRQCRPLLADAGLDRFDAVMATLDGDCMRALADRENWRLALDDDRQRGYGVYLKKHHVRTVRTTLRALLGMGPGESAGRVEARNVGALADIGVDAMRLLAYGEKLHRNGLLESFVLTEELAGFTDSKHFLRQRFSDDDVRRPRGRNHDLDRLIRQVARVARRFHEAGYNHRDLYCGHFFIRQHGPGRFEIRLIDLQRVQRRRWRRRRWIVKDLAQLLWSAPPERIRCSHKLAFMRHYLGVKKLRPRDKRLIRSVMAKHRRMVRRLGTDT